MAKEDLNKPGPVLCKTKEWYWICSQCSLRGDKGYRVSDHKKRCQVEGIVLYNQILGSASTRNNL